MNAESAFWDGVARKNSERPFLAPAFARYKAAELRRLLAGWLGAWLSVTRHLSQVEPR